MQKVSNKGGYMFHMYMYSLGVLSRQVIEKKEEKDWFESLDYEDLNLEGSLYMYIGGKRM